MFCKGYKPTAVCEDSRREFFNHINADVQNIITKILPDVRFAALRIACGALCTTEERQQGDERTTACQRRDTAFEEDIARNTRRMKIEELHIGMLVRSDKYPHRILRVEAIMPTRTYVSYEDNGVRYRVYNLTHEDLKHIEF